MFDITPDDINQLNDIDLRELIGRLCEAELVSRGLSPAAVTWGGHQTAADGGLDVRVALSSGVSIDGFIPRASTGFQVKKPDMPRAAILDEMRPVGVIRPVIQELADEAGAYIMVSSNGSTADRALRNRRNALREALHDVANADQLHTDFFDRTRLATWVRRHAGVITWVKEKVGRAFVGWRPYGPWSGTAEGVDAEYLLDDKLRLHLGTHADAPVQSVVQAINELRDKLAQPGKIVRLVGLSGVGKTRFVQALFDTRVGLRSLPPALAVYTNLSDNPDPQPTGLVSEMIANRMRAVLVVDNCPSDLHRRLSELCDGPTSTVSLLTVEYDVRDDQPEGTQVVTLDTSSLELIEKMIRRRYQHLSAVDALTISGASGGNARIAIALAETVERADTIAGLSNDELFQRLFRQRQDPNDALLRAAEACSLVYSFQGEALTGEEAELPRLASLAGQSPSETYRHVGELLRRDLVQQRGEWRAVLPHAVANRLATRALDDIPYELINEQLVEGGTARLAQSFSRRLSFLHHHPKVVAIVEEWLAPEGLLGDVTALNDLGRAMFENVAPVSPDAALATLERAGGNSDTEVITGAWQRHLSLLRSLAYDVPLFQRSAELLARIATQSTHKADAENASNTLVSLFTIHLSGTHAPIEQRLSVIEHLLKSGDVKAQTLGLAALGKVLEATHFSSSHRFDFGARSRDYGYQPQSDADVTRWYGAALALIERLVLTEGTFKRELLALLVQNFRALWTSAHMHDELEKLFRTFAAGVFWYEGWAACRQTMHFDRDELPPDVVSRLSALEADLRPSNLLDQVRAIVLGDRSGGLGLDDEDVDGDPTSATAGLDEIAGTLATEVASDDAAFAVLLPELLRGGNRAWEFGRGLARASRDIQGTWTSFVQGLEQMDPEQRDIQVLRGFLAGLWDRDKELTDNILDSTLYQPVLQIFLPALHSARELDERGVERLKQVLNSGNVPVRMYRQLTFGGVTAHVAGGALRDMLLLLADQPEGVDVALEILHMRLFSDRSAQRTNEPKVLEAGRDLLRRVTFREHGLRIDHLLSVIVKACCDAPGTDPIATELAVRLTQAVAAHETYWSENGELLRALFELHAGAILDALFVNGENDRQTHARVLDDFAGHRGNPADAISCEAMVSWCESDRERRYALAASIITFARRAEETGPQVWSAQARALLTGAPDPEKVLALFLERFRPRSWSGSRAAIIEANARLLDSLVPDVQSLPFVTDAKARLAQEIARERQWEIQQDRARDERFE